jgi:hypothetical protein
LISKEFRNRARFIQIVIISLLCEIFFWWICPISLIFGISVVVIAIFFYKKNLFKDKFPKISYFFIGILFSISYAIIYGALEFYVFQNPSHPLNLFNWFQSPIPYWVLLILSHFLLVYFICRNLSFSIVLTLIYCVNEDFGFWIVFGLNNGVPIMPPPINWFESFPTIFPQWFIDLGTHLEIWPYVPVIYILIWIVTIPLIITLIIVAKNYEKKNNFKD